LNTDNDWLLIRRRIHYSLSVIVSMIGAIGGFTFVGIAVADISPPEFRFLEYVILGIITAFTLVLIIPAKVLKNSLDMTKSIEKEIVNSRILSASFLKPEGATTKQKMFNLIKNALSSFDKDAELNESKHSGIHIIERSPKHPFPQNIWDTRDIAYAKDFAKEKVTSDKLKEFLQTVGRVVRKERNGIVHVFCFGDSFDESLTNDDAPLKEMMKEGEIDYLSVLQNENEMFSLITTVYG
tara:strand:- start:1003 stop:1719 length:717 start_codon:yes stop_codon:yes gene_type:complete